MTKADTLLMSGSEELLCRGLCLNQEVYAKYYAFTCVCEKTVHSGIIFSNKPMPSSQGKSVLHRARYAKIKK